MSRRRKRAGASWREAMLGYGEGVHVLRGPASPEAMAEAERRRGRALDEAHRAVLARHDGGTLFCEAVRLLAAGEIQDDIIGLEGEDPIAIDDRGRVLRLEAGGEDVLCVGSSLPRWLDSVFAREALVYDEDGEFRDVFDGDSADLRPDVLLARERAAARADPAAPAPHFELGRLLASAGQLGEAAEALVCAEALDPSLRWAPFELGRVLRRLGRPAEAAEAFARAAAASRPPDTALLVAWAARAAGEAGDRGGAARLRARVRLLDPDFASRYRGLGRDLRALGDPGAADLLALAAAIEPGSG